MLDPRETIHVWAVPGAGHIIDQINPETGLTDINGHDAATIQAREPGAVLMTWDAFLTAKATRQQTPIAWIDVTTEKYTEMLEVLPPFEWLSDGFLVGEPSDHCAATGQPRYAAYRSRDGRHEAASRPMTRAEFRTVLGRRRCDGTHRNGPDKRYTRCDACGAVEYETNEGDRCRRIVAGAR